MNPLLSESALPYGLPPFAEIHDEHFREAFEHAFAEHRAEIEEIASQKAAATFENTFVALERSGQTLARVAEVFYNKCSADSTPITDELEPEIAERMAEHEDAIHLDPRLLARVEEVFRYGLADLDAESRYLAERYRAAFTRAGAGLPEADAERLREYNRRLSALTTRFERNLLADTNELALVLDDVSDLDGLGASERSAAAAAAAERGLDGIYLITLVLPTGHPYLEHLTRRPVRERLMAASRARGSHGGEHDNRELVLEITRLRAERARLLGFDTHAAYVTADETAGNPEAVAEMLESLAPAAARNARAEQADLTDLAGGDLASWDWAYYTRQLRQERFQVDTAALRDYFEAERVLRDGVFYAANRLYGVRMVERPDLTAYHPDARVFEVFDHDGTGMGLFILDLYTRDSKRGGAWMNALSSQSGLLGRRPVVVNNHNVPKPAPGEPTLLTVDEVETLFHEFGHALHGLFARVTYPLFAGTNVFRDVVEFPSQVNEMWMLWPEVLANYARHHRTGEPLPQEIVERLEESKAAGEGFATSEYLAAAHLDQSWHRISADDRVDDVAAFERAALADAGLDNPLVPSRYSSTYFAHVFSGGYDAGYYSYIWSEVLDADTVEWFRENGGLTRENGDRFRELVLAVGGSKPPLEAFREFRGRDAEAGPLLRRRRLADDRV